jgi:hypothetical protein
VTLRDGVTRGQARIIPPNPPPPYSAPQSQKLQRGETTPDFESHYTSTGWPYHPRTPPVSSRYQTPTASSTSRYCTPDSSPDHAATLARRSPSLMSTVETPYTTYERDWMGSTSLPQERSQGGFSPPLGGGLGILPSKQL